MYGRKHMGDGGTGAMRSSFGNTRVSSSMTVRASIP